MDVKQVLVDAWKAVEAAELPEHVHAAALEQAVRLLAGDGGGVASGKPPGGLSTPRGSGSKPTPGSNDGDEPTELDEEAFFSKFADESGVDADVLRAIYAPPKDGRIRIGIPRRRLGDSEAEKNRTVGTLVAGARWYVEGKASVLYSEIREVAKATGYEPSRNLSGHLDSIVGTLAVGTARDKALRVQGGKFDVPFAELVARVTES